MSQTLVTLTTDFGTADGYVAAMKGVIASLAPNAKVVDASHEIAAGDVAAAAWVLSTFWSLYPPGTVHVVVVDPGVGSDRRALAIEARGLRLVGPDNGVFHYVFSAAFPSARAYRIENPRYLRAEISTTFHGRDVFAPAAAWIAQGVPPRDLGPPIGDPVRLDLALPDRDKDAVWGEVVHVDQFGNLITNIPAAWIEDPAVTIEVGGHSIDGISGTYADAGEAALCAVLGSSGTLEISVVGGSAADFLGISPGLPVRAALKR